MATTTPHVTYALPKRRNPFLAFCIAQPLGATGLLVIVVMAFAGIFCATVEIGRAHV